MQKYFLLRCIFSIKSHHSNYTFNNKCFIFPFIDKRNILRRKFIAITTKLKLLNKDQRSNTAIKNLTDPTIPYVNKRLNCILATNKPALNFNTTVLIVLSFPIPCCGCEDNLTAFIGARNYNSFAY